MENKIKELESKIAELENLVDALQNLIYGMGNKMDISNKVIEKRLDNLEKKS